MTFSEHLEELRSRVIHSLLAFVVAFLGAFAFQDALMGFFTRPYDHAAAEINADIAASWPTKAKSIAHVANEADLVIDELEAAHVLAPEAIARLRATIKARDLQPPPRLPKLNAIGMGETFSAYMLVCMLAASLAAAPFLLMQLWKFVAAGLYDHERRIVLRVLPFSLLLFFLGLAFGYFVLAELSVRFLVSYGDLDYVEPQVSVGSYFGLLFLLLLVMGLVFQIPLIMTILSGVGVVQPTTFTKKRKHFILGIFIVAAIITPPDYISQLLVAGPMLILFELGVLLAKGAARKRAQRLLQDQEKKP